MIAYLRGKLLLGREDYLVIDVQGVGYQVYVPSSVLSELPPKGEELSIYIYTAVREDAITLYGFATEAELELFKLLITVSGIGPKVASGIVSAIAVAPFKQAVVHEDITTLRKIPGIGEKTAKRLILELKSKIQAQGIDLVNAEKSLSMKTSVVDEAVEALIALGYSRIEAFQAVEQIQDKNDLQAVIRKALKYLGQGRN